MTLKPIVFTCALLVAAAAQPVFALGFREELQEGDKRLQQKQLELAEGSYRHALRDVKRDPGAGADDRALCLVKLGAVLQMLDITEEAQPLYKKAIKVLSRAHGAKSPLLLPDLMALGLIFELEGDYKKAIKIYQRALDIATVNNKGSDSDNIAQADCEHDLGRTAFKNGDAPLALASYRRSMALYMGAAGLPSSDPLQDLISDYSDMLEKKYGPGRNLPSAVRNELLKDRLGDLPQKRGVLPSSFEKEVTVRLAREAFDKVPVEELTKTEAARPNSANAETVVLPSGGNDIVADQAIGQQKIAFYERMIAVDIKSLGAEHPSVARDLSGLGAVYMAAGRYDEAKIVFMRALKIYETVYGDDAMLVKRTRTMLELVTENQIAAQSGDGAGTNFVAALPPVPLAAQKLDIAISLNYLAALCFSLGRVEDAEKLYAWSVSDTYHTTGERSLLLAAGLKDYARVLRTAGGSANVSRAEVLESDARAITRRVLSQQAAGSYQ